MSNPFYRSMRSALTLTCAITIGLALTNFVAAQAQKKGSSTKEQGSQEKGSQEQGSQEKGQSDSKAMSKKAADKPAGAATKSAPKPPTIISVSDDNIYFAVSSDWKAVTPKSRIVEREFSIPASPGDKADGRLTVMGAGGSIETNLNRWYAQFTQPDGKSTKDLATVKKEMIAGQQVHIVEMPGTFSGGMGPMMASKTKLENYRMLSAIISTEKHGQYFVKLTGPAATIDGNREKFMSMVNSLSIGAPPSKKQLMAKKPQTVASRDGGLKFDLPGEWERVQLKATSMLDSELSLPASQGDAAGGRLTLMKARGSVDANVSRWHTQFSQPDGKETSQVAVQTEEMVAKKKVHLVDISGTFGESMGGGPFGKKVDRKDYRMLVAMVELGEGDDKYFLKLTGPQKTIAENEKAFKAMVRSMKVIE